MTQAIHLPANSSQSKILGAIRENGYIIIDKLASTELMDQIAAEMAPYIEETPFSKEDFLGKLTRRTGALIPRSPSCRELIMNPVVLAAAGEMLEKATTFQLHLTSILSVYPGSRAQQLHQDEAAWDLFPFPDDYEVQLNTLWALSDYTEDMGATRVVPGSQYAGRLRSYEYEESIAAEMERGSVLLYTGKVYHGAGANRSDKVRQAINLTYSVGWVRQEENQFLSTPVEVARTLSPELLRLMGYQCGCLGMGIFRDYEDPMNALFEPEVRSVADATIMREDKQAAFIAQQPQSTN